MYPAIIGHPAGQIFPAAPQQNYFTFHQTGMILSHSATADSSGGFAPVVITLCLISHRRFHPGSDLSNFGGARDIAHTHHPPKSRRRGPGQSDSAAKTRAHSDVPLCRGPEFEISGWATTTEIGGAVPVLQLPRCGGTARVFGRVCRKLGYKHSLVESWDG